MYWQRRILGTCAVILISSALNACLNTNEGERQQSVASPTEFASGEASSDRSGPKSPENAPTQENRSVKSDATALEYAEQRADFLEKVEPLFGSREKRRGVLYRMVTESLGKESVPFLREMLQDESYKARWGEIGIILAWVSDESDEASAAAIIDFIRRPYTWPSDDADSILDDTVAKGSNLHNLGLFKSDLVSNTLRNAITEDGAEELIRPWISIQTTVEPLHLVCIIRKWAVQGLVLTRDPENIALVCKSYETLVHKMLSVEYKEREIGRELWLDSERHSAFAWGMANNDMLEEMGVEEFKRLRDDSERWARTTFRYLSKYEGTLLDDERTVMARCPICGKTAE